MFYVILGIIGFIVAILAFFMERKFFYTSFDRWRLWGAIGLISLCVATFGTCEVVSDVHDIHDTERTINAYIDSEYDAGLYCMIRHLDNKKAWADTPFSLWSSKKIKALRYKAVESYNEIIRSRSDQQVKNEPKNQ
jgi:hypothetical protein